ncbi:hypothetical protein HW555_012312 [Spodoptera exigua]|uniref:Uncharacterized protein n=1 Tax=Spodoptera exigua TaxID=7107 RepID=A0A835KZR6_SPOEX|nr:hypothetical protein HW555_012312 [Spodoptera exigua]
MPKRNREDKEYKENKKRRKLAKKIEKYKAKMAELDPQEPEQQSEESNSFNEQMDQVHAEEQEVEPVVDSIIIDEEEDMELSSDIVSALGEVIGTQGDDIHPSILKIIENILTEGLTKEQRETINKSALIPGNAKLLDAPKLNTEIIGLINQATRTRDTLMVARQQDLGLAIGTICQTIHDMTKKDYDKIKIIKMLGESARLLSNLHCQYTNIRKRLISPFLDKALQLNLKDNKRTEFLYSKLEETVKTTTAMKRAANILKPKNFSGNTVAMPKNYQQLRRPNPPPINRGINTNRGRSQQQTHNRRYQPHQPQKYPKRQQPLPSRPRAKYP